MPIRERNDAVGQWNYKTPFNKDNYVIRCIEESFGISKGSGNPMITRTWEIVSPEEIQIGDRKISVAGQQTTQYLPTMNKDDKKKDDAAFDRLSEDYKIFGHTSAIDTENPELIAKGKKCHAVLKDKVEKSYKNPTAEEIAQGKKTGEELKDPITGQSMETHKIVIESLLAVIEE